MSKIKLLLVITLIQFMNCSFVLSQDAEAVIDDSAVSTQLSKLNKQLEEIKGIVSNNNKDTASQVGKLILIKSKEVTLYSDVSGKVVQGKTINIDKVIVLVKDGFIVDIQVLSGNRIFSNGRAPIEISTKRLTKIDALGSRVSNTAFEYIYLYEIIQYVSIKPFIPDNDFFELTPSKNLHILKKGIGLNSVVNLRLFTDALGAFGGKSNGLIQTEASVKQVIHRSNLLNRGIFIANYFKFDLVASKFDSKLAFTDSATLTRTSILQKNWLNVNVAINAINGWLGKKTLNEWFVDLGGGVNLSNVAFRQDTVTITSSYFFLMGGLNIQIADNMGASISSQLIWNNSPQTDFNNNAGERLFVNPTILVFWNPLGNEASRIFSRVSYNVDTRDTKSHFLQFQLGYTMKLSSLKKE